MDLLSGPAFTTFFVRLVLIVAIIRGLWLAVDPKS